MILFNTWQTRVSRDKTFPHGGKPLLTTSTVITYFPFRFLTSNFSSVSLRKMRRNPTKRRGAPAPSSNPSKRLQHKGTAETPAFAQQQHAGAAIEEDMMDEDVFLEETALKLEEDEEALLLMQNEALSARLSRWKRPSLSSSYLSSNENISMWILFTLFHFLVVFSESSDILVSFHCFDFSA